MIVVDVEASGVSPEKNSLVSIGAVDFNNPSNRFYEECKIWEGAHVEDEALEVNGFSHSEITDPSKKTDREVIIDFLNWIKNIDDKTLAGHNPSFDRDFMQAAANRYHISWPLAHRTIDLHSICYFDMIKKGIAIPKINGHSALNSDTIFKYLGMSDEPKPHNALTGAIFETEAFGRLFYDKPFLDDFEKLTKT
jgi:DNA polymerase III epsilon subunit-like protein